MPGPDNVQPKASYVPLAGVTGREANSPGSNHFVTEMGKLDAAETAAASEDVAHKSYAQVDPHKPCLLDEHPDEEGFYHCIRVRRVIKHDEQDTPPLNKKIKVSEIETELPAKSA